MNRFIGRCKDILSKHYGSQFEKLVVYGSAAREQNQPESDIDLLVVLKRPFDYFRELRVLTEILYPIQIDCDQLISAKPVASDEFEAGTLQIYRNAKREGLTV